MAGRAGTLRRPPSEHVGLLWARPGRLWSGPWPPASLCPCRKGGQERLRAQSAQDRFPACCWPEVVTAIPGWVVLDLLHTGGVPRPLEPAGSPLGHRKGLWVGGKLAKPPQARAELTLSRPAQRPKEALCSGPEQRPTSSCLSPALTANGPQRASLQLEDSDWLRGGPASKKGRDQETCRRGGVASQQEGRGWTSPCGQADPSGQ